MNPVMKADETFLQIQLDNLVMPIMIFKSRTGILLNFIFLRPIY